MDELYFWQTLWFFIVIIPFAGYSLLDGFDLGIGMLLPFFKSDGERRALLNTIGPFWDANEVWLIIGGGVLLAVFPKAYYVGLSSFYLAFMLFLFSLILRAVSLELRHHSTRARGLWDYIIAVSSLCLAAILSLVAGAIIAGVPFDASGHLIGSLWLVLLRPFPASLAAMGLFTILMEGMTYAIVKTSGAVQQRAFAIASFLWIPYFLSAVLFLVMAWNVFPGFHTRLIFSFGGIAGIAAMVYCRMHLSRKNERMVLPSVIVSILSLWLVVGSIQFPSLIRTVPVQSSITIYNASNSLLTLKIMTVFTAIGLSAVIAYTWWVYHLMSGKVTEKEGGYE